MSYLNKMYGSGQSPVASSEKNPNRVTGGLKAQGVDSYKIVAEDGSTQEIPTQTYVRSLEDQIRKQRAAINVLERKVNRNETATTNLANALKNVK